MFISLAAYHPPHHGVPTDRQLLLPFPFESGIKMFQLAVHKFEKDNTHRIAMHNLFPIAQHNQWWTKNTPFHITLWYKHTTFQGAQHLFAT